MSKISRFGFFLTWLVLTLVYIALYAHVGFHFPATLIGIFVPFGLANGIAAYGQLAGGKNPLGIMVFALLVVSFFFVDRFFEKKGLPLIVRIPLYLVILVPFTFAADFSLWGSWLSVNLLTNPVSLTSG